MRKKNNLKTILVETWNVSWLSVVRRTLTSCVCSVQTVVEAEPKCQNMHHQVRCGLRGHEDVVLFLHCVVV